jgi:ribosome maturation factor RimP
LLGVRVGQQGKNKSLEVSIYRKEPAISFSDCEQMSRSLDHLLETEENKDTAVLSGPYLLEVVSAGIDRQLTNAFEFNLFAGSKVRVTAKEKIASLGVEFIGTLIGGDEESIVLGEATSLSNKSAKGQSKSSAKKQAIQSENVSKEDKLTINLQQIYKVYLWPELKESKSTEE